MAFQFHEKQQEALTALASLASEKAPSKDALVRLQSMEALVRSVADNNVSSMFLAAVAKHLVQDSKDWSGQEYIVYTIAVKELAESCGVAASHVASRAAIIQSGILVALQKVRSSYLGPSHVEFLQCALLAGQYRYARRIVGNEWPRPDKGIKVEQILRYFYLRGMIHIGCDEWKLAIRCFWTVLSVPSGVVSAIAIEAWKKMVLVKCLVFGDTVAYQALVTPPSSASNAVSRYFTTTSSNAPAPTALEMAGSSHFLVNEARQDTGVSAYLELIKAGHGGDMKVFDEVCTKYAALMEADNNMGLVERLRTDLQHRHLRSLSTLYASVPAVQVVSELGIPQDELLPLLSGVEDLSAAVDGDGMITFRREEMPSMDGEDLGNLVALAERVRKLDATLSESTRFQSLKGDMGKVPLGVDDF